MRRKRAVLVTLLLLAALIGSTGLWLRAQRRQYALNRALIYALVKGDDKQALALVKEGASPNTRYKPPPMPSLSELVKLLLHHSPPPVNDSPTAWMIACGTPWSEYEGGPINVEHPPTLIFVQTMLEHGADVNAKDDNQATPLLGSVQIRADKQVVRLLLERGANVNAMGREGTALMNAYWSPEIARLLLEHGAEVNLRNYRGRTALMIAYQSTEVVRLLLEHGAEVNAKDDGGETALLEAVRGRATPNVVQILLEHGADVNSRNQEGWTPLMVAYESGDTIQLLLQRGADIKAQDDTGRTALYWAVEGRANSDVVRQLLMHGADPDRAAKKGLTPLMLAIQYKRSDLISLLKKYGANK